ncbi:MAG: tail fiber domain-containing protein [Chitinophagaceae bacterium]|nr:tail fiber domain-containing protein [Chitinophagaceae bacterium]
MKKLTAILSLTLCAHLYSIAQPANDNSCGAISIPVENLGCEPTTVYNYTAATWSSGSANTWCENFQNLDVWYRFIIPSNGKARVTIAASDGNSYTAEMYTSNTCNSLAIFNSFNNGYPCLYTNVPAESSREFTGLTPGGEVYMRVYRRFSNAAPFANGSIKICVSNNFGMADDPCSAGFFPVDPPDPLGQDCTPVTSYSWTGATLTPSIPNPSCIAPMPGTNIRDVWFKLRVPASGKLRINHTYNGTCLVAYTATACNGTFTELGCTFFGLNWTNLTPNSIVYIRMMRYTGTGSPIADGSAKICVAESNQVPTANNSTKVGIGIDTPFAKLDVVGNGIFRDKLTTLGDLETRGDLIVAGNILSKYGNTSLPNNTSVGGQLSLDSLAFTNRLGNRLSLYGGLGNTPQYGFGIQSGLLQIHSDASNTAIAFGYGSSTNFSERARIINSGEFGMNITGRLQLRTGTQSSGVWLLNSTNTASPAFIGLASDSQVGLFGNTGALWGLTMNTTTGNVGIGLNGGAAAAPLTFANTLAHKITFYQGATGPVGIGVYGGELRLQNDIPNGKVSLGALDAGGNYFENAKAERNGTYAFSIFGDLWVNGVTYASDEHFKQNITDIQSPLQKLLQLKGVEYEMKSSEFVKNYFQPGRQIGLLAQDVEKVIPEAVNEKDGYKGVDYAKLVPLLIEAIKEQQKQIEEQRKMIEALQRR